VKRSRQIKFSLLILSIMIVFSMIAPSAIAQESARHENKQPQTLGKVNIKPNVEAQISNLIAIPSDKGKFVSFTVTINNNSNTELDFVDYWTSVSSKGGTEYSVSWINANANNKVPAKSSKDFVFYTQVGANIELSDLIIKVIQWDFSVTNFKRVLGQVSVPERYRQSAAVNENRVISSEDARLSIYVERASIGKSDKYYRPDIRISIKNVGKTSVVFQNYVMSIITQDGLLYNLDVKAINGNTINPLAEREFQLTGSIPIEADPNNWKLVVMKPVNDGKVNLPVALFDLPKREAQQATDLGKYYTFSTSDGTYSIRLDSLNRLPIEDQDLIVGNLTLSNLGTEVLPLPNLTGKFTFDEFVEREATVSSNDKIISISPNQSVQIQAVTKVPYTLDIGSLTLAIQQQENTGGNTETLDLVEFTHDGSFNDIPVIPVNGSYAIEDLGYRAEVSIRKMMTFKGSNANIVAAQINIKNLEKRVTNMQKLAGYFEHASGVVYQAKIESLGSRLQPNGTAVIYAWATVPQTEDLNDLKLVLGKAVEQVQGTESQLVGYVNSRTFNTPEEAPEQTNLQQIDLYPYTLTINKIGTQLKFGEGRVVLDLTYTLDQDLLAQTNLEQHKVVIEIADPDNETALEQEYSLVGVGEQAGSNSLQVGKNNLTINWIDEATAMRINTLKNYSLNIYLQIQPGYKKLVATQSFPWFVQRTLSN